MALVYGVNGSVLHIIDGQDVLLAKQKRAQVSQHTVGPQLIVIIIYVSPRQAKSTLDAGTGR